MPQKHLYTPEIKMDDKKVENVSNFNFLGITINQHLNWATHINSIAAKLNNIIGIMYKLKNILPKKILKVIYNSLFLPHLNYGLKCWGFQLDRIFKLQKKAIRIITLSKYNAHTEPLFKREGLLKVQDIFKQQQLIFGYNLINKNLPIFFRNYCANLINATFSVRLRNHNILRHYRIKHVFAEKCLRYNIIDLLNNTSPLIIDKIYTHSRHGFSLYIKKYILNSYNDTCTIPDCYTCRNALN